MKIESMKSDLNTLTSDLDKSYSDGIVDGFTPEFLGGHPVRGLQLLNHLCMAQVGVHFDNRDPEGEENDRASEAWNHRSWSQSSGFNYQSQI